MDEFAQTGAQQDDLFDEVQYDQPMQTRASDDLFSHEIQPVIQDNQPAADKENQDDTTKQPEAQESAVPTQSVSDPSKASTESTPVPTASAPARGGRGRGDARGRGRGRGRGNQDRSNQDRNNQDRNNQDPSKKDHNDQDRSNQNRSDQGRRNQGRPNSDRNNDPRRKNNEPGRNSNEPRQNNHESRRNNQDRTKKEPQPKDASKDAAKDITKRTSTEQQEQQEQQPSATTTATTTAEPSKPATNAVRGDRTATGGLRKPKLSEQELAEKMSRISLKNEKLAAAHARAEADAADFAEREEVAAKRRQEERRDRQQMMGEREKNRLRKLKAVGGREWDAEKPDDADAFGGPRQAGGRGRGAHGGIAGQRNQDGSREGFSGDREDYTDGREYMYREDRGRGRGRGRGGRGGAPGRGGRGPQQERPSSQSVPKPNDFPDLSGAASAPKFDTAPPPTMAFPTKAKVEKLDIDDQLTPGTEKKSWADMME
ncbi:hypothetical protein E4T52_00129 [Aureobasidium sp. EXF-3400]|nr:hypothetical protein E4T51_01777 [Aureobasidium sp. EXF-12344]KAI4784972.1 hypothetical protein E4T52_00129 [Aureobasidium sp. EXF-3400]